MDISYRLLSAVVLVILLWVMYRAKSMYDRSLEAVWVGDDRFLAEAGLSAARLYLSPADGGARQGHLLMRAADGQPVANTTFEFREEGVRRWASAFWASAFWARPRTEEDTYTCEGTFVFDAAEPPFPERVRLALSALDGTLTIYDDSRVYLFLERDQLSTALARGAWAEAEAEEASAVDI